jgi:HK97 family phage portal protein
VFKSALTSRPERRPRRPTPAKPRNPYGTGGVNLAFSTLTTDRSSEQLAAFRDWVYTSISPIAKRIAGQSLRVGIVKGGNDRSGAVQKPGMAQRSAGLRLKTPQFMHKNLEDLEPMDDHPLVDLFNNPNEVMVPWSLVYFTVCNLLLTGKAFWWIVEGRLGSDDYQTRPQIWPIPSHWVRPQYSEDGLASAWQIYTAGGGPMIDVPNEQMLYFNLPDPADPLGGLGPVQALARAIRTDRSIQTAQSQAFENGIFPNYAVMIGDVTDPASGQPVRPELTPEARDRVIRSVKRMVGGAMRAGEPIVLDALIQDLKKLNPTNEEMEFLESSEIVKSRVLQGFGVNPIILGQVEAGSRASSAMADHHFCQGTVNPIIDLISQVLTAWFAPFFARKGEELAVWIEPARPHDTEERRAEFAMLQAVGGVTIEEMREAFGLPIEMRLDDTVMLPISSAPVRVRDLKGVIARSVEEGGAFGPPMPMPMMPGMGATPGMPGMEPEEEPADQEGQGKEQPAPPTPAQAESASQTDREDEQEKIEKAKHFSARSGAKSVQLARHQFTQAWNRNFQTQSGMVAQAAHAALQAQLRDCLLRLPDSWNRHTGKGHPPEHAAGLIASEIYQAGTWDQARQQLHGVLLRSAISGVYMEWQLRKLLGKKAAADWWLPTPLRRVLDVVVDTQLKSPNWVGIAKTTLSKIVSTIRDAISGGETVDEAQSRLADAISGPFGQERARRIAESQTLGAVNAGMHEARMQWDTPEGGQPKQVGSTWLTMRDDRVRSTHQELEGVSIGPGELFDVGGHPAPYPGHWSLPIEETANCRCTAVPEDFWESLNPGYDLNDDDLADFDERSAGWVRTKSCGAGEPGSPGFQPGNTCGQGEGSGDDSSPATPDDAEPVERFGSAMLNAVREHGGFSTKPYREGSGPITGFMVSRTQEAEFHKPVEELTEQDILDYMAKYQAAVDADPRAFIGSWVSNGLAFLDIAHHYEDQAEAEQVAIEHNQDGYFDVVRGETIYVKSESEQRHAKGWQAGGRYFRPESHGPRNSEFDSGASGPGANPSRRAVELADKALDAVESLRKSLGV